MENIAVLRRVFVVFGIAFIITVLLIYFYRSSFERFNESSQMLVHTITVQDKIEGLNGAIKDTESGTRGYVITNDSLFLYPVIKAQAEIESQVNELKKLCENKPVQLAYIDSISYFIDKKIDTQNFIIHLKKSDNLKFGYLELLKESNAYMDTIRTLAEKMKNEQGVLRSIQDKEVSKSTKYSRILSTIFSITAISIMILSLLSVLWEIRSKKKVKELLKTVLESSQSGIMSFIAVRNQNGEITDFTFIQVNKIAAELIQKSPTEVLGKSVNELFPGNNDEDLFNAYVEVTQNNTIFKTEKHFKRDKRDSWYRIVAVKLEDGFTVTFDDISKEKRYEIELQNNIEDLKRSNSELEQFAFVASHDLQEPLRKIQTFGERLKVTSINVLPENSTVYIDKMLAASKRMSNLINDLLSFSRLARTDEAITKINLNEVLADVKNDLELSIHVKKAIIKADELPVIEGVPTQIYQLLFNLIGNALKFSRDGVNPIILIKAEAFTSKTDLSRKGEPYVRIIISDNGIGFESEYAGKIFEIFQRLHGKSEYEGTGIGLAICKRIVTNHRGNISAQGEPGKGADFIVELPVYHS